ncbi:MAG: serine hydroxymethyltransferase [Crenarchaeota archaeon]|nr:serine hydroxymethyltransferase [Thermoproteota archaeon]
MHVEQIIDIVEKHNAWRGRECINLVASENVMSTLAKKLYLSDFMHRYNEHFEESHYQGTEYCMEIENIVKEIFGRRFQTDKVEPRPLSGGQANLIVLSALTSPGDTVISVGLTSGAHVSHTKFGVAGILHLNEVVAVNNDDLTINVDATAKIVREEKPKLIILGRSLVLFPEPLRELRSEIDSDILIVYDVAHVFGLIYVGMFQEPLEEGADVITTSTHKTFPGPQGGLIIARKDFPEKLWKKIYYTTFPGLVYNHHIHRLPALAVTALEMNLYGKEYMMQTVRNAKRLAEELYNRGFKVLCADRGFTETHQVLIDVREFGGGAKVARILEENNIIVTKVALPWDSPKDATANPSGIRIGLQEMTRYGMKDDDIPELAEFFERIICKKENIKEKVIDFRRRFREITYCFKT